jgi:hypothetical protein
MNAGNAQDAQYEEFLKEVTKQRIKFIVENLSPEDKFKFEKLAQRCAYLYKEHDVANLCKNNNINPAFAPSILQYIYEKSHDPEESRFNKNNFGLNVDSKKSQILTTTSGACNFLSKYPKSTLGAIALSGAVYKRKAIARSLKNMYNKAHDKCVDLKDEVMESITDKYFDIYDTYEGLTEGDFSREEKISLAGKGALYTTASVCAGSGVYLGWNAYKDKIKQGLSSVGSACKGAFNTCNTLHESAHKKAFSWMTRNPYAVLGLGAGLCGYKIYSSIAHSSKMTGISQFFDSFNAFQRKYIAQLCDKDQNVQGVISQAESYPQGIKECPEVMRILRPDQRKILEKVIHAHKIIV